MKTIAPRSRVPAVMAVLGTGIAIGSLISSGWLAAFAVEALVVVASAGYYRLGGQDSDVGALVGSRPDERQASVGLRASAFAGIAMSYVAVFGFIVETARGGTIWPFALFCAVSGSAFLAGLLIYRTRG